MYIRISYARPPHVRLWFLTSISIWTAELNVKYCDCWNFNLRSAPPQFLAAINLNSNVQIKFEFSIQNSICKLQCSFIVCFFFLGCFRCVQRACASILKPATNFIARMAAGGRSSKSSIIGPHHRFDIIGWYHRSHHRSTIIGPNHKSKHHRFAWV